MSSPAVINTRRVDRTPCPSRHCTAVSDTHEVDSHPVCPARDLALLNTTPSLAPNTVIIDEPVPARFVPRDTLNDATSNDDTPLTLPPLIPPVRTTRLVPFAPCWIRHLTDVSESQLVLSHLECPPLAVTEYAPIPICAPCKVTDADPVPARFDPRIKLTVCRSVDHTWLALPASCPAVIMTRRVPFTPCPTLQLKDVSDSQLVDSQPDSPSRTLAVNETRPMLAPCTVTDADPDPPRLPTRIELILAPSTDHACDKLPTIPPAVITTRRVPPDPWPM